VNKLVHTYSIEELDNVIKFIDSIIMIDDQYLKIVERAIKQSMNKNYADETVERLSKNKQNIRDSVHLLDKHVNNFQGIVFEKIEMYNYNYLKNSENIITLTNPDPTSKSDIIHIINQNHYSLVECGPDVKYSGDEEYVVNQYIEKHLKRENSKGFIDITGYLDDEDYIPGLGFKKLSKGYNRKILKVIDEYGYKPTISPAIPRAQFEQIFVYYINYLKTGKLPSHSNSEELIEVIKMKNNNELRSTDLIIPQTPTQECVLLSDAIKSIRDTRARVTTENDKLINQNKNKTINIETKNVEKKPSNSSEKSQMNVDERLLKKNKKEKLYFSKSIDSIVSLLRNKTVKRAGFGLLVLGAVTGGIATIKRLKSISSKSENIDAIENDESDATVIYEEEDDTVFNNEESNNNFNGEGLSISSIFSQLYKSFKEGQITKSEFYDKGSELEEESGKNLSNYLRFLKNVKHEKSAEDLLDHEVDR
jgi:hypothetical protein